jgi:hypothetical protein
MMPSLTLPHARSQATRQSPLWRTRSRPPSNIWQKASECARDVLAIQAPKVCKPSSGLIFENFNQVTLVFHNTYSHMAWPQLVHKLPPKKPQSHPRAPTAGDSKPAAGTCHDARG